VFVAAGAPFEMTVTAVDAEGTATPNYGREAIPESVRLATQLVAPAGGSSPAIGWAAGFGEFTNGTATGNDFAWSEVGIVRAVPGVGDEDYLLAGDVIGPLSEPIGRFVPSHFVVDLNPPPLFTAACSAGGFTYHGQPFGYTTAPVITATAVAADGATTTNYTTDQFFKLSPTTLNGRTYSNPGATLDTSGLPDTTVDPAIARPSPGVVTLTFSAGSGLAFAKGAPQAPFDAEIQLAINVEDSDGVVAVGAGPLGNPVTFGTAPGGIPFVGGSEIRYGRIRVGTAVGSELVDLPVPMRAEHYAGSGIGFVTNAADVCTSDLSLTFPPTSYTKNLNAGETCVRDSGAPGGSGLGCAAVADPSIRYSEPPVNGDFRLQLAAPGAGNQGSVGIVATVPAWLEFDWNTAAAGEESPAGQATFGVYSGERRLIYTREIP
jgi:MSHA biogenesis protein MshQ